MSSNAQVRLTPSEAEWAIRNSRIAVEKELRIVIVGKTGVGKSATANTISGSSYFASGVCAQGITSICQQQKVTRFGKDISIIDTPGLFDTESDEKVVEAEIKRCVHLGAPGLHAILYVMEIGRFTEEDVKAIRTFLEYFESEINNRMIIVFTHGNKLLEMKQTLSDYLKKVPVGLEVFLVICEKRVILFNNEFNKEQSNEQVLTILMMIETLKEANEFAYYYDAMFQQAEERVQQREKEIRKMLEKEYTEKIREFEKTAKIKLQKEIIYARRDELEKVRSVYKEKLSNVREEVRKEIKSKNSTCTIL